MISFLKPFMFIVLKVIFAIIIIIFLLGISIYIFTRVHPVFGDNPKNSDISPEVALYEKGRFKNFEGLSLMAPVDTPVDASKRPTFTSLFFPPEDKNPLSPLPSLPFDHTSFGDNMFSWLGHSTLLMRVDEKNIIVDPVFHRASPVPFFGKPFEITSALSLSVLPPLDIVLITHDHYDHLDYKTIKEIGNTVQYIVPLGVKAHLLSWGIEESRVQELDWYGEYKMSESEFIFTPSQHFSGRNFDNRNTTLWGGWIIKSSHLSVYVSGDGGYFSEFKTIGEKYGPFDIAFLENGAYNTAWKNIHMMPEESVQAGKDVHAKMAMPVHWGKFDLSSHRWDEPIQRFIKAAEEKNLPLLIPQIGQVFDLSEPFVVPWWKEDFVNP